MQRPTATPLLFVLTCSSANSLRVELGDWVLTATTLRLTHRHLTLVYFVLGGFYSFPRGPRRCKIGTCSGGCAHRGRVFQSETGYRFVNETAYWVGLRRASASSHCHSQEQSIGPSIRTRHS